MSSRCHTVGYPRVQGIAKGADVFTQGTLLSFIGNVTVTTGQMFTVTHDDGLTLIIGGLDLGFNPVRPLRW
jgi:hypothetical protein